jgi:hypothetical protein
MSRLGALRRALGGCALALVWQVIGRIQELKTVDGKTPPLKPEAAQVYARHQAQWRAGDLSFDPTAKCISPGMPRILYLPYPFRIIQRPQRMTYLFEWNYWNRHVYLDGKNWEAPYLLSLGESNGHWQGDTLVIHTDSLRADNTLLDSAGMPHSENLMLTEQLRLVNGGRVLEDRIHVEDPDTFVHPWDTVVRFRRLPDSTEIGLDVCLDRVQAGKPAVDWSRAR